MNTASVLPLLLGSRLIETQKGVKKESGGRRRKWKQAIQVKRLLMEHKPLSFWVIYSKFALLFGSEDHLLGFIQNLNGSNEVVVRAAHDWLSPH